MHQAAATGRARSDRHKSIRHFSAACVLALAPAVTLANITPSLTTVTGSGPYTWSYSLTLASDQDVHSGTAPVMNGVPHTDATFAGFLTLYDFGGYVAGSCAGPAGWVCTAQNVGFTPDDVVPNDNPGVTNITWAYTSGPEIVGSPSGVELGTFDIGPAVLPTLSAMVPMAKPLFLVPRDV